MLRFAKRSVVTASIAGIVCAPVGVSAQVVPSSIPFEGRSSDSLFRIPEFSDNQRFLRGANEYGPFVRAYALLQTQKLTIANFNSGWQLVGLVLVDTWTAHVDRDYTVGGADGKTGVTPVPGGKMVPSIPAGWPSLKVLGLGKGWNCVFLKHTGASRGAGWSAEVVAPVVFPDMDTHCSTERAVGTRLRVLPVVGSDSPDAYPGAARILPLAAPWYGLGFRCANVWCNLVPGQAGVVPPPAQSGVAGVPVTTFSTIPGWFDDQRLSIAAGASATSATQLRASSQASIVPDSALASWRVQDFEQTRRLVARIVVKPPIEGKYQSKWGLEKGVNKVYIQLTNDTTGVAWIETESSHVTKLLVHRKDHHHAIPTGYVMPATARWAWIDSDDAVWIYCDIGCCYIDSHE